MGKTKKTKKRRHDGAGEARNALSYGKNIVSIGRRLAETLCEDEGIELVHLEYLHESRGNVLRVYIDKEGGVCLDDCANISRQLNDLMDIHFEAELGYRLEVSSPGEDRPLSKEEDYERFKGSNVKLKTKEPVNGRKTFTGTLMGMSEKEVLIQIDGDMTPIPFDRISRGRLVHHSGD